MTCKFCHEFCPPARKDGFCSDICEVRATRAENKRLRDALELIAGSSTDKLQALQAKAALTNIGAAAPELKATKES